MSLTEIHEESRASRPLPFFSHPDYEGLMRANEQSLREYYGSAADDFRLACTRMALVLVVSEQRGLDIGWIPARVQTGLRALAYGRIIPEAFARFHATGTLEKLILNASPCEQRRLADGEPLEIWNFDEGKEPAKRLIDPLRATLKELRQAFGEHGLRSAAEQRSYLESLERRRRPEGAVVVPEIHPNKGVIVFPPSDIPLTLTRRDLIHFLGELSR